MTDPNAPKSLLKAYWVLLLAPFLLLSPVLARGQALFWGTPALQFVPWWWQGFEQIRAGVLPLWNPLNGMGAPLMANYQMALFYPPNFLVLLPLAALAGPAGIAWGYTVLAALHLAWAGLGMALLLRRLGFGWHAQIIGGLAYGLSGVIVGRMGFFSMTWVAAWLPWILYGIEGLIATVWTPAAVRTPAAVKTPSVGLVACVAMQLLAGHAQFSWYTLLLAGGWLLAGVWRTGAGRYAAWIALRAAGSVLLGASMAMVQLLPTAEYLSQSQRAAAVPYEEAMQYSFWPWRLITLFSPDFFGNPGQGNYWGYASYWEDHAYAGFLPLALALAALVIVLRGLLKPQVRDGRWRLAVFAWGLVAAAGVMALGKFSPVFPFLYRFVPTFDMFQAPARYLIWLAAGLPILAAIGLERWRSPTGRGLYWFRLATAGAFAVTLGAGLGWLTGQSIRLTFIRATALTGVWALCFGLLTLVIPWVEKGSWRIQLPGFQGTRPLSARSAWRWAVIAWVGLDLLAAGWSLNPGVDLAFYGGAAAEAGREAAGDARLLILDRVEYDLKFARFLRFKDFRPVEDWRGMRGAMLPNLNLLDGVAMANNFDPLVPGRFARWMAALDDRAAGEIRPWLDVMGVGAVGWIDARAPGGVRFDRLETQGRLRWFACIQKASDEEDAWNQLQTAFSNGEGRQSLVVEGWPGDAPRDCDSAPAATIRIVEERPDRLVVEVSAPAAGWLFQADTWYPGWRARLDGAPVGLYRAHSLFRAVPVPAGTHLVQVFYTPVAFYFGALLSILGLFASIALTLISRGRPGAPFL